MVVHFIEVCKRRGLKVNAGEIKVMVLNGEERLEFRWGVIGMSQNLNTWDVLLTNQVQTRHSVLERWQVGGELQEPLGP